jgi:anti-sigma factor RsiW
MIPFDPAELSAYLDGELPAARANEVRAALAQDPELRRAYELLAARDADWSARAETTKFQPHVRFAGAPWTGRVLTGGSVVLGLLLFRMILKALPAIYGASLEAALLVLVVGWGLGRILHTTDADCRRPQLSVDG